MKIDCCHHCENRHEKCHAHCETYLTQKMLKILVEASDKKEQIVLGRLNEQRDRAIFRAMHRKHLRRRK